MLLKGPLKKGDVRVAIDKRIESARRELARVEADEPDFDIPAVIKKRAECTAREAALQSLRKELLGERLPRSKKK